MLVVTAIILLSPLSNARALSQSDTAQLSPANNQVRGTPATQATQRPLKRGSPRKLNLSFPERSGKLISAAQPKRSSDRQPTLEKGLGFDAWLPARGALGIKATVTW